MAMPQVKFNADGEAQCDCGGFISRYTAVERIESLFLSDKGIEYETVDFEDGDFGSTFACESCNLTHLPPDEPERNYRGGGGNDA